MFLSSPLTIAQREVKDALSDWRTITPMLVLAVVFPILMVGSISIVVPYMDRIDPAATTEKLVPFGAMMVGFFPISFSLVMALESFVGEKERNTLEALLSMPLSDAELFIGKLLAALLPPITLSLVALSIYTAGLRFTLDFHVATDFLIMTILLSVVEALVMVAGAVVISSHTTSVRAASLLGGFIILPMALAVQGELMLVITGNGRALWFVLAELLVVAIILVRMGVTVFNREEILARENDQISARSVVRNLWRFLKGLPDSQLSHEETITEPLSPWRLYRDDVPQLLRANWQPALLTTGLVVIGAALGYILALRSPLPEGMNSISDMARYEKALVTLNNFTTWGIFFHNLRALSIGAVLSIFTFGSASLILLLLPVGLAGWFTGQASAMGVNPITFATAFFVPHGLLEIPVAILATTLSMKLGLSLMRPPKGFTFGESLLMMIANWLKMMLALTPFLLLASYIEANITPMVVLWLLGGR